MTHPFRIVTLIAIVSLAAPNLLVADTIKIGGTGASLGTMRLLGEMFKKSRPETDIQVIPGLGSGGARKALLQGALDVAVTSRSGSTAENVPGATARELGRTPFVFAVQKNSTVEGLTIEQVVNIYSGKVVEWPDGKRLRLILRPETDSDTEILKKLAPGMSDAVKSALARDGMRMALTDQDSADAIESVTGAIGTSTLAIILAERRSIKPLSLNQVAPSPQSISDGSYSYYKSFHLVTKPQRSESVEKFVSFVRSPEAHKLLSALGYWVSNPTPSR